MTGLVLHSFAAGAMAPDTAAEITALNAVTASAGLSLSQAWMPPSARCIAAQNYKKQTRPTAWRVCFLA